MNDNADPRQPTQPMDEPTRNSFINHHLAELSQLLLPELNVLAPDAKDVRTFTEQYEKLRVMLLKLQPGTSRSLGLAFTNLEQSYLWLNRHLSTRAWK